MCKPCIMQHTSTLFYTVWFIHPSTPPLPWPTLTQCPPISAWQNRVYSSCKVLIDWLKSLSLLTVCLIAMETLMSACNSSWSSGSTGQTQSTPLLCSFPLTASLHMQKHTEAYRDLKWPFKETQLSFLFHCTFKTAAAVSVCVTGWRV